jgi:uncharacterized membrane protein
MPPLGLTHTGAAIAALVAGAAVLLTRKGTRRHRQMGWAYVVSMFVLNVTALLIYRLFGRFGPFHAGAVFSLVTVLAGTAAALGARRVRHNAVDRARALERHYQWMTWSYVGLVAAAVSETATRMPALRPRPGQQLMFGVTVAVATLLVVAVGALLIRGRRSALLAPYKKAAERAQTYRACAAVALPTE